MRFFALNFVFLTMFMSSAKAQEAPVVINSQTGAQVELVRAYWDPNTDIANRVMQCDFYMFNVESQVYEETIHAAEPPQRPWHRSSAYYHLPLPRYPAPVNSAFVGAEPVPDDGDYYTRDYYTLAWNLPFWSVKNGVYSGIAPLLASEFVEITDHGSETNNAVRVWHTDCPQCGERRGAFEDHAAYHVCYDPAGGSMVPTGQPGVSPQLAEPIDDLTVTFENLGNTTSNLPVLVDRETGETIEFTTGRWNYNRDIALRQFWCATYTWDDSAGKYLYKYWPDINQAYLYHPYNGGDSVFRTHMGDDSIHADTSYRSIENDKVGWFDPFRRRHMEVISGESDLQFRIWGESNGAFTGCRVSLINSANEAADQTLPVNLLDATTIEFSPTLPLQDNDASDNSETPVVTDECDYTSAEAYDGWGWNPVTMSSCPPLTDVVGTVAGTDNMEGSGNMQTNPDTTDNSADLDASNPEDSNLDDSGNATEDQDTATDTTLTETGNSAATTAPSSGGGGGTIWLPFLFIAIVSRRIDFNFCSKT